MLSEAEYIARAGTGALLNPRFDSTFKALFTQPSAESREAMRSFLEAATERRVTTWQLSQTEVPVEFHGQRGVCFDLSCSFDDGRVADIEMQAFRQPYDYGRRAEYQVARLEAAHLKRGEHWKKAPTVYQISVLDYDYSPDSREPVSRYAMRTKDGRELTNLLNIVFIELPKVTALENSVERNTALENWGIFLKDADNPEKRGLIQQLARKEKGLMEAQKALSSISADQDLWLAQYRQEIFEHDMVSRMESAEEMGLAKGLERGRRENQLDNAYKMLADGMSPSLIAKYTGLSLEEIDALLGGH